MLGRYKSSSLKVFFDDCHGQCWTWACVTRIRPKSGGCLLIGNGLVRLGGGKGFKILTQVRYGVSSDRVVLDPPQPIYI